MPAFYQTDLGAFLSDDPNKILGLLISAAGIANVGNHFHDQTRAWEQEIAIIKAMVGEIVATSPSSNSWGLLLEYPIPRRNKRLDAVILAEDIIFVLEFKVGAETYDAAAKRQVEDYALDLRDFHKQSLARIVIPVLVATQAPATSSEDILDSIELVRTVRLTNSDTLAGILLSAHLRFHDSARPSISRPD